MPAYWYQSCTSNYHGALKMGQRKKVMLWTLAVVIWFFIHTILLLFVLTGIYGPLEEDGRAAKRRENVVGSTRSGRHPSPDPLPKPLLSSRTGHDLKQLRMDVDRKGINLHFKPSTQTTSFEKFLIGPKKMARLDVAIQNIMRSHSRPGEDYYGFNITRSEEVAFTRDIPDKRPQQCKDAAFNYSALPTVSVVTPVHNEALSTLVRHVFAILLRTPNQLLKDIILVDDNSTFSYLGQDLENYFRILDPRIKILRNNGREGLVMSRLHGAEIARGDVVVFLDAHMEVCTGWSEPLLDRINSQSAIVVQPDVPTIDGDTFDIETGGHVVFRGGFGWDMRYAWMFIPPYVHQMQTSRTDPIPTPVLVGCAIAVNKKYFNSIGGFDPGLQIWGGEHFDLSFKVWTSGGRVETIPCSKVGHLFKSNKYSYGPKGKGYILSRNLLRVAEVWMDEYKEIVYATSRHLNGQLPVFTKAEMASIEERRQLRRDLKCKDFSWFLKHIMPEIKIPTRDARFFGEVTNHQTRGCFYVMDDGYIGVTPLCFRFRILPENTFTIDVMGRMLYDGSCVGYDESSKLLKLMECPCMVQGMSWPKWEVNSESQLTYTDASGTLCATHVTSVTHVHKTEQVVQLIKCKTDYQYQKWHFMYHFVY
ncbi:polypeptide N-acetylgalactosaminyltransferase 13-like [Haliotis cracherodii]|uniref:polypeptide N-acetylgalactosaminyltransferase 13-like n=1 Tax=Haliotis cracherodii TaxID=6455 RepID=UPI0039E9A185